MPIDEPLTDTFKCEVIDVDTMQELEAEKKEMSVDLNEGSNLEIKNNTPLRPVAVFFDNKHPFGRKVKDRFYCSQTVLKKTQPDCKTNVVWILHNLFEGNGNFFNQQDEMYIKHYVESGEFEANGCCWKLRL